MKEEERLKQREIWKSFCNKFGVNNPFVLLATKEYNDNLEKYQVTLESSKKDKEMAADIPVILIEVGMHENDSMFYARFAFGEKVKSWWYKDRTEGISFECHYPTPDEAYEACMKEATMYNQKK